MSNKRDRELGLNRRLPRRDFINGVAITIGASLLPRCSKGRGTAGSDDVFAPERAASYYPPELTGLRGSYDSAYEHAHAVRSPGFLDGAGAPRDTAEAYDLVVVGGGISGLTAAHAFRKEAGPAARVLVLDNHDDFGGHAKRNEFKIGNRTVLGYGGTFSIDSPAPYSAASKGMISELGVDVSRWEKVSDFKIYTSRGLGQTVFFDKETFGADALVPYSARLAVPGPEVTAAESQAMWKAFMAAAPMAEAAKRDLRRLFETKTDFMPGLTSEQKKAKLAKISYRDFLLSTVKVHKDVASFFQSRAHGLYGLGMDAVPAQDAWGLGLPGFGGMKLASGFGKGMNHDAKHYPDGGGAFFFHFPDGNASIARLIVRRLIPGAIPGSTADDIVTARCDYSKLDDPSAPARIRLNSTVVRVKHRGDPASASDVEVAYIRGGKLQSVSAKRCILACWHTMIPYICPELPDAQRQDLAFETKVPIVYTNVLLANWQAFVKAGASSIHSPGAFNSAMNLDLPVSLGAYRCSQNPDEPIVVHLMRTPGRPGGTGQEQHKAGREELFRMTFEEFERSTRDQMARALGPSGFDPARDIKAITVNRWAHGYAYQYNSLFDDFWLEGKETPCERARKPFGRLAIANADSSAYSYTDAAIDNALRAVKEVAARS